MARKSVLNYLFCNSLALVSMISLAITEVEAKSGGSSTPTSSRKPPSSTSSSGSSGTKTKKVTRCYNEQMVEITCPVTKSGKISGYVVGGIFVVILLFLLYKKLKGRYLGRTKDLSEAKSIEPEEEDKKAQRTFDDEKGGDGLPVAPPPQYIEKVADERGDSGPSSFGITPPVISMPVPEPAQPNLSTESRTMAETTSDPLPQPATTPSRKHTLAGKLRNVLQSAKQTTAT
ncbi:hypothetical protein BJ322DRAFT_979 [Thelephora terrestris]|uniref:Uncharacterized protein n=1 Tax=Thelephora terrestris TaxID=56493 RepID=A0A9P6HNQ0_9AGAM|nr:hypothetical protein BJ322DRAFT_979 [Thelephora terrestris]